MTARGRADWATTGGSTPIGIYRVLMRPPLMRPPSRGQDVHVWWGDDRFVPRDHPLSNVKPLDDILLGHRSDRGGHGRRRGRGPAPGRGTCTRSRPARRSAAGCGADWCAAQLAATLRSDGPPAVDGWPVFDLVMLGMGGDGHVLSVFPGSAALASTELCLAIPAPTHIEPHVERVTINPAVIGVARQVLVVATGAGKASVLAEVFGAERDPSRWPAQLARIPTAHLDPGRGGGGRAPALTR